MKAITANLIEILTHVSATVGFVLNRELSKKRTGLFCQVNKSLSSCRHVSEKLYIDVYENCVFIVYVAKICLSI